jgi:hypothetical protein
MNFAIQVQGMHAEIDKTRVFKVLKMSSGRADLLLLPDARD